ncbi:hypothetical protein KDK95_22240 [Actinospica sp. MGRD01-02]|uniref:DUF5666 domain-containing protein n=1 Tax=Actinospica acidithermotolerans TaxID=2828514 RepID=A0A941EE78_9ACTN|nr:hypothetical protein [Actinospica acidithermotolerans]MBR7829043.1 hypothetical protein [Actinospica acidithermotolerans]
MNSAITMRRAVLAAAGIAVAGGVVFGATEAFAASPAASAGTAADAASTTTSTTEAGKACADAAHPARCAARHEAARDRGARFKGGAHGQETVKDKAGSYVVREWQVGKVESVSGSTVTVKDGAGATWTWTVDSATKYRVDGTKGALSGVHAGDTILIRGQQKGSANDATAVFDPNQSKLAVELQGDAG